MKKFLYTLNWIYGNVFALFGALTLLFLILQFTPLPWKAYQQLATLKQPVVPPPSHILLMGGSGIPGESGLMRTYYAAQAARQYPQATLLVAMPRGIRESATSDAYYQELLRRGVRREQILWLPNGRNTREQALRLIEYLTHAPPHSRVLIVTSPEHIRRTALCIRRLQRENGITCGLIAGPAYTEYIDDNLEWSADELVFDLPADEAVDDAGTPTATSSGVGKNLVIRYRFWGNLGYSGDVFREYCALAYYKFRSWI